MTTHTIRIPHPLHVRAGHRHGPAGTPRARRAIAAADGPRRPAAAAPGDR